MAQTKTKAKADISVEERFASIDTNLKKSSKNLTPSISVKNKNQINQIQAIVKAKSAFTAAKSQLETAQERFRAIAKIQFENLCRLDKKLHSSVRFIATGDKSSRLLYIQPSKLNNMWEVPDADPLTTLFQNDFADCFEIKRVLTIDSSILTQKQINKIFETLRKLLPEPLFKKAVNAKCKIIPKERYFQDRILNDRIRDKAQAAEGEGLAVPSAASFKLN